MHVWIGEKVDDAIAFYAVKNAFVTLWRWEYDTLQETLMKIEEDCKNFLDELREALLTVVQETM